MPLFKGATKMALLTKKGQIGLTAFNCLNTLENEINGTKKGKVRMHLKFYGSNGRTMRLVDSNDWNMRCCLERLNINFVRGNDAPRGGVCGDYIELTKRECKKAIIRLHELMQSYPRNKSELAKQLSYID